MAINSRTKGAAGERELSNILKGYGYNTRRGQQFCGANGDADVVGLDKIHIECKRVEKLNIDNAIEQAKKDARGGEIPCVFHRKNHKNWLVTMELSDWIEFYKKYTEVQNG
jgi:Holliday junction resolvase